MRKSAKSWAEEQFTATKKKTDHALKEKDRAWQEMLDKTARLKALRLAKAAADNEAAELAEAAKPAAKSKKPKRAPETPSPVS